MDTFAEQIHLQTHQQERQVRWCNVREISGPRLGARDIHWWAHHGTRCRIHEFACWYSMMQLLVLILADNIKQMNFYKAGQVTPYGEKLPFFNVPAMWSQIQTTAEYQQRLQAVNQYNTANRWTKRGISLVPIKFGVYWAGSPVSGISRRTDTLFTRWDPWSTFMLMEQSLFPTQGLKWVKDCTPKPFRHVQWVSEFQCRLFRYLTPILLQCQTRQQPEVRITKLSSYCVKGQLEASLLFKRLLLLAPFSMRDCNKSKKRTWVLCEHWPNFCRTCKIPHGNYSVQPQQVKELICRQRVGGALVAAQTVLNNISRSELHVWKQK